MSSRYGAQSLAHLDPTLLRAVLRERTHHSFEYHFYRSLFGDGRVAGRLGDKVEEALQICSARGLSPELPNVNCLMRLLELAKTLIRHVICVALGWPGDRHLPPGRIFVSDAVIAEG